MSNLSSLNDQQNLTLTQISYCSNMLSKHHGKSFAEISVLISKKNADERTEEEEDFLKLMGQFPSDQNPFANYIVRGTENNHSSGFGAVAFTDGHGNTGISYRGTDGLPSKKSANDWVDNAIAGITGDSTQSHEAEAFFERYSDANGNNYLYGHSKGGNLSEYVFVKYYEKIKGMHLLNPQPLNPWTLSLKQLEEIRSDKVDIVVVEGDYVWFIGMLPSYGNVRVADSNDEDSHSYWSLSFTDGSISKGNHPWIEYLVYFGVTLISPFLQGGGAIFGFFCDCVEKCVDLIKKGRDKCKEFGAQVCNQLKKMGDAFVEFADGMEDFIDKLIVKAENWYNRNLNAGYKSASANPRISVDIYKLRNYAQRIQNVNRRIGNLDRRLDSLYRRVGLLGLWNLMQADCLTGYSWRLLRCASYLNDTASDFEAVEKELAYQL